MIQYHKPSKEYTRNLYESRGIHFSETFFCELCAENGHETPAVDTHHIVPRGMGGSKLRNHPENLLGLCRACHEKAESGQVPREYQLEIAAKNILK